MLRQTIETHFVTSHTNAIMNRLDMPSLYRSKFVHIALWSWVTCARNQGIEIQTAIVDFQDHMNVKHIPYSTLYMAYFRMSKRFVECRRTDNHFRRIDRDMDYFMDCLTNDDPTTK